jgi:hypothetical protein
MALRNKPPRRWASRLHFLIRLLGVTGILALVVVGFLGLVQGPSITAIAGLAPANFDTIGGLARQTVDTARAAIDGSLGDGVRVAVIVSLAALAAALLALFVELVAVLRLAAGARSMAGSLTALQVGMALLLLVGVNLFSFYHYFRFDLTRDHLFTLPSPLSAKLSELEGETTIIVFQQHKTSSKLTDKPDAYDYAAERKVVEKVKDLVDQFREFGKQFRVEVLDVEAEGYSDKFDRLVKDNPKLREAIDAAPENSIFFHARHDDGKELVQRLSFNEFYQLDRVASKSAEGGDGNLVLRNQGPERFSLRMLNVDERRPRIGLAVVHPILSTESSAEMFSMAGARKTLLANGFDVRDIILKKNWGGAGPPEPGVATFEENRYETLEDKLADLDATVIGLGDDLRTLETVLKQWQSSTLDELTKAYAKQLRGRKITEAMRRDQVEELESQLTFRKAVLTEAQEDREKAAREKESLRVNRDSLIEQKRITDLRAKLDRALADCDLLIVPRATLLDLSIGWTIDNRAHQLESAQVDAIKDFLKAGKPVLACLGPTNEPTGNLMPPGAAPSDGLENLFAQLGIQFGKQTVLFDAERKSFAERRTGFLSAGGDVKVPSLDFLADAAASRPFARLDASTEAKKKVNPLRAAMRIVAESSAGDLDLSARHPRPVSLDADKARAMPFEPEFLLTSKESWNDDNPFPSRDHTPRPETSKSDDPARGTPEEKRRGPFAIGIAVEVPVPTSVSWFPDGNATERDVRVVAIGHGHLFTGKELSPAKEQLLLNTCNWLLGRGDDRLPSAGERWSYPRVQLSPLQSAIWRWGVPIGLPVLFIYLGIVVVMVRRLR